jgi:hypothetical protein
MRRLLLPLLVVLVAPAAAQERQPEWRQGIEHHVLLRVNAFEPELIRLPAGEPVRLVFYNSSRSPLSLQAGSFFGRARVRAGDADLVANGGMTLAPGETRAVNLVPSVGRYRLRSRSWLRRLVGMSALIVVEPQARTEGQLTAR